MKTYNNFTEAYHDLLKTVYCTPEFEAAPRGLAIKERIGHSFRITNIRDRIPYIPHRKFSISYMIAELIWYLSGSNSTEWISNYSGFWRNISDDGKTANSAYGARIFQNHPYQNFEKFKTVKLIQWEEIKSELKNDPDSRRAVIHIRMPQDTLFAKKDVPCTLTLQFLIRDGALHQVASMRSSDLILGLAYDVPAFTLFQELLAFELGVECGTYTHISNSLHIYEKHYKMVERILNDPWVKEYSTRAQPMPTLTESPFANDNDVIKLLVELEGAIRESTNKEELYTALFSGPKWSSYWDDWLTILASHKAKQLGLNEYRDELLNSCSFKGYTLFRR